MVFWGGGEGNTALDSKFLLILPLLEKLESRIFGTFITLITFIDLMITITIIVPNLNLFPELGKNSL